MIARYLSTDMAVIVNTLDATATPAIKHGKKYIHKKNTKFDRIRDVLYWRNARKLKINFSNDTYSYCTIDACCSLNESP